MQTKIEMSFSQFYQRHQEIKKIIDNDNEKKKAELELFQQYTEFLLAKYRNIKNSTRKKQQGYIYLRLTGYYLFLAFGLVEDAMNSFLCAQSLLVLIPGLTNPYILIGCIIIIIVNALLFYAMQASYFKKALGILNVGIDHMVEIQTYKQIVESTVVINQLKEPFITLHIDEHDKEHYCQLTKELNNYVDNLKQEIFKIYEETPTKKTLRWSITIYGAMINIAGTYFIATAFLSYLPLQVIPPIGWLLIAVLIIAALARYFLTQQKEMVRLVNPEYKQFKELKKSLKDFVEKKEISTNERLLEPDKHKFFSQVDNNPQENPKVWWRQMSCSF